MSCNCQHRAAESPEQIVSKVKKGTVKFCDVCDPCNECVTNVKICAFVVPTLEEGRYFKNSFIFVQEDDSVYFISDDRSEIPFGSRPKFIEDFDPTDAAVHFKSTVVYDVKNQAGYVYDPEGNMVTIALTAAPFSSLTAGEGIIVEATGGDYTVSADTAILATKDSLDTLTSLVTNHTGQIIALEEAQDTMAGDIETIEDDLAHAHDLIDDANELAVEAKENAASAQQTANDALSAVATKQDALTAGANITIANNVISATDTTYERATAQANGLMSNKDREALINTGLETLQSVTPTATEATIDYTKTVSDANGSTYTPTLDSLTIPAATQAVAGLMTAADKTKLDGLNVDSALSAQSTNPVQNRVIYDALQNVGGGLTEITSEDNNYTMGTLDGVALWLLPAGAYKTSGTVTLFPNGHTSTGLVPGTEYVFLVSKDGSYAYILHPGGGEGYITDRVRLSDGNETRYGQVVNSLLATSPTASLSANQGHVLKGLIDALDARVSALEGN